MPHDTLSLWIETSSCVSSKPLKPLGSSTVLIGATAMGFHGLVRATEDVDLFIRATPENVERLREGLRSAYGGDPHIDDIRAADLLGEYPAVRVPIHQTLISSST